MRPAVEDVYRSIIHSRMKDQTCELCGESLEAASVTWAEDGSTFDDLGLTEESTNAPPPLRSRTPA